MSVLGLKRFKNNDSTYRMDNVKPIVQENFQTVKPEVWAKCCNHVAKVEEEFWTSDTRQEEVIEAVIIENPGKESDMSEDYYSSYSDSN